MKKTILLASLLIPVLLLASCKEPDPGPLTKKITVPAINNPITDPLDFGAVSALSGWDADFPSTDVTYILTLDNVAQPAGTTSISANGLSSGAHTISQTFYYKGNPIPNGSRSGVVGSSSGGTFLGISQSFPELTLLLRKNAGVVTKTVTKDVTVNSKTITLPAAQFDFNPQSYSPADGNWGVFDQNKLTFTLTDNVGGYTYRTDGIVEPNAHFNGNPWPAPVITQTFYYDGIEITGKTRSIMLLNTTSLSAFDYAVDATDTEGDNPYDTSYTFPPINLTLTKTVTE